MWHLNNFLVRVATYKLSCSYYGGWIHSDYDFVLIRTIKNKMTMAMGFCLLFLCGLKMII